MSAAQHTMRLDDDVRDILDRSIIEERYLTLPGQLDRKTYIRVAKALELLGGAWDRKLRCHVFQDLAADVVADAVATGAVTDYRKTFQFFETPDAIADILVSMAEVKPHHRILEPSAGKGRIIEAIRRACQDAEICACELMPENAKHLQGKLGVPVIANDFLALEDGLRFDRIVANPPFARQQDIRHVEHMWRLLARGGRLVSVMTPGWTFRNSKEAVGFRYLVEKVKGAWSGLPQGSFVESGTAVNAGVITLQKDLDINDEGGDE